MHYSDLLKSGSGLSGRGDGKFARIRELANKLIPAGIGECLELSVIAKQTEKIAKLASSQEAYNYAANALKSDVRFIRLRMANKRIVMMRVNGDKAFAEKAITELAKAGRLHPKQGALKEASE
jgi:hypothetical protein